MKSKFTFILLITVVITLFIYVFCAIFTPVGEYICNKREEVKYLREIKKNPNNIENYHKLTILYWKKNDYNNVLEWYKRQLSVDTTALAELHAQISNMFLIVGSDSLNKPSYRDSAFKYVRKAQMIGDEDPFVLSTIANLYKQLGEDSLALELYKEVLTQFHGDSLMLESKLFKQNLIESIANLEKNEKQNN